MAVVLSWRSEKPLDQRQHLSVADPARHALDQFGMRDRVEGNSHTLPITRIFLQTSPSLDHIMLLKVCLLWFREEFIGKVEHTYS